MSFISLVYQKFNSSDTLRNTSLAHLFFPWYFFRCFSLGFNVALGIVISLCLNVALDVSVALGVDET